MAREPRDKRLNILVTASEHAQLQELADREGITASDYVRLFVRRQHAEVFGAQQAERTKPKARKR